MIDFRMQTFIKLCETMNYRKTAKLLNMTQPAVTQHIQYLEKQYGCKLFEYDKHVLHKTLACKNLEHKVRAVFYIDQAFREEIKVEKEPTLKIGATKTIAEFVLPPVIDQYIERTKGDFTLMVANTQDLLTMLDEIAIDFALIEGLFDKSRYGYACYKQEKFVGICAKGHTFAGQEVNWEEILKEVVIIREEGSGTRTIFEDILRQYSYSLDDFKRRLCISHFTLIKSLVAKERGITFAYESILQEQDDLATFYIKDVPVIREFNYVYLKGTPMQDKISLLIG